MGSTLSTGGQLAGALQGLTSGNPVGEASGALQAGKIANAHGYLGNQASTGGMLNGAMGALQLYNGIQQGGVVGGLNAADGAIGIGSSVAGMAGDAALSNTLGEVGGYAAIPLAAYNFATQDTQSGATGSDALGGAENGAMIGTAIAPGIGTAIGAVVGGAAGAISSAFGGGRPDPETQGWNSLAAAQAKNPGTNLMTNLNPAQAYQSLAGIMDAKNNSPGHSTALEQVFGRMGEGKLMDQMTGQINSALSAGTIKPNSTPSQIFQQVVQPWLTKLGANVPNNAVISSNGSQNNGMVQNLLTQLISQWQSGSLSSSTQAGVAGQTISGLSAFGAPSQSAPTPTAKSATPRGVSRRRPFANLGV